MLAVVRRMASPTAAASGCSIASGVFESEDFILMDGECLQMPCAASALMDSCQFSHDTFSLAGDPYLQLDDVTRSFVPGSVADVVFKMIPKDDRLVPTDALAAWRGHEAAVNLDCNNNWFENCSHDAVSMVPIDDALVAWAEQNVAVKLDCKNKSLETYTVPYSRRFLATDLPPGVPLNVCFRLQSTTYWLPGVDAHVIVNMLLDFLTATVTATITKVSYAKFSIKVNICMDGGECAAKLRMYSSDANHALAFQLQRRSGCGLVFNRFHQEVGCHLVACQKSVPFELLTALEGGSSPVRTDTKRVSHSLLQIAWTHEEDLFCSDQCIDV
jgi:hypothetical protein